MQCKIYFLPYKYTNLCYNQTIRHNSSDSQVKLICNKTVTPEQCMEQCVVVLHRACNGITRAQYENIPNRWTSDIRLGKIMFISCKSNFWIDILIEHILKGEMYSLKPIKKVTFGVQG